MKRIFDMAVAAVLLALLLPLFAVLALLTALAVGAPFFRQVRFGKNEKRFHLYKFKSMRDIDRKKGLVSNKDRITKWGRFLRNTSLDELPGLWNIMQGDMSFVGPRPLLVEYLPCYQDRHRVRHSVRPGLTGLAQINGRNDTSWEDRLNFDVSYVENRSFFLDLKILLSTMLKVLKKEGVENTEDLSIIRLDRDSRYLKG